MYNFIYCPIGASKKKLEGNFEGKPGEIGILMISGMSEWLEEGELFNVQPLPNVLAGAGKCQQMTTLAGRHSVAMLGPG